MQHLSPIGDKTRGQPSIGSNIKLLQEIDIIHDIHDFDIKMLQEKVDDILLILDERRGETELLADDQSRRGEA